MKVDFVLLIMNCYKYRNKAIAQATWLSKLPDNIKYYHVIGDINKCDKENLKHIIDESNNILYVRTNDDYNSLPSKVISAFEAINSNFEYKYIFKTDDDQMLIKESFFSVLPKFLLSNTKHEYGGFIINVPDHISSYYKIHDCLPKNLLLKKCVYCNGRFYFLSKSATENLITKKQKICETVIEDHAIGLHLDEKFKENILSINSNKIFVDFQ